MTNSRWRVRELSTAAYSKSDYTSWTAIDWCHQRFPTSQVNDRAIDLFAAPAEWKFGFHSGSKF